MPTPTALTLDISGSRAMLALVSAAGELTDVTEVRNVTYNAAEYWPAILDAAAALAVSAQPRSELVGVGVSFGGPVDRDGNVISVHVPGWAGVDVGGGLSARLGLPAKVENDANCGALGEYWFGHWGQVHTIVFMTCSTGIGSGIVSDGWLFKGARGLAGEVGHNTVNPLGRPCVCGSRGCLERQCSGSAMGERSGLPHAKALFDAVASGDEQARAVLEAIFEDYGRGIAAVQHAYDPDLITIGGGVSLAGAALTRPVAEQARRWIMRERREHLRLEPASLGLHSQLYGAAALVLEPRR